MTQTSANNPKRGRYLLIGFFLLLALGLIYAWSVIGAPIADQFAWDASQTSFVFSISMVFFCLGGILGSILTKKFGVRKTLMISASFMLVGCLLTSLMTAHLGFCLTYGVLCGTGVGLAYNVLLGAVGAWYPDKPGLCSGILLMGFGLGGLILGTGASKLEAMLGWETTFVIFATMFTALLLVGAFTIRYPGKGDALPASSSTKKQNRDIGIELNTKQMIRRPTFWLYFVWAVCFNGVGLAVIGQARQIAISAGASVDLAVSLAGAVSVCNGVGRIIFGNSYDRFGRRNTMVAITLTFIVALALLIITLSNPVTALLIISFFLLGAAYGGTPTTNATFVNRMYGKQNYASNLSIINTTIIPASLLFPAVASSVMDMTGSYLECFVIFICISAVAALLPFFIKKP